MAITQPLHKRTPAALFVFLWLALAVSACKSSKPANDAAIAGSQKKGIDEKVFQNFYFEGLKEKALGNYPEAIEHFDRCLKMVPDHPPTLYEKSQILEAARDYEGALALMEKAVAGEPDNRWFRDHLATLYQRVDNYPGAAEQYLRLTENYPGVPEYAYELANMYLYADELEKAAGVYDTLENRMGFNEDLTKQKYKIYLQLEDTDRARGEVEKLLASDPEEVQYYNMLANLYQQEGNIEKAIETIEALRTRFPDDPMVYLTLADYYREAGDREKSFEALQTAFANPSLDIDNKINILLTYYRLSNGNEQATKEAYSLLELTEQAHPEEAKVYAMYGDFLMRDEKIERARDKYKKAIELDDTRFLIWNQLLFIHYEKGDTLALLEDSKRAIDLFPNQPIVYFFNGMSNLQLENYQDAVLSLEQGQGLVVENPQLQFQFFANLGDSYYHMGKHQQAWMNYERALRIDPESDFVLNNYAYYLSLQKQDLEKAKKMAFSCVKRNPDEPTYLDTYGWVLYQMGDYQNARTYLERAVKNGGTQGEVLEHLGDALFQLGEIEQAVQRWEQARDNGGASPAIDQKIATKSLVE